jgi:glycosyltransferase involved in cell wall biosynthesis
MDTRQPDTDKPLKIGIVHRLDARSILSWSGTAYFMCRALGRHVGEIVYLGPDTSFRTNATIRIAMKLNFIWKRLTKRGLVSDHSQSFSKRTARFYERQIAKNPCDILFAPAASVEIANIKTPLPIVYTSDTNWADLIAYVPEVRPALESARRAGDRIEAQAVARADAIVYPSKWPIPTAIAHYGAPAYKIFNFPWGANLEFVPDRAYAIDHPLKGRVNLLLVGVDWARKGGAIAFECLNSLIDRGIDAHLTLCGCVPPPGFEHPSFRVIPYLSKRDPVQREQISQLFHDAHFLLLPTRAEAFGIVICEAASHGLPALVTDTGGTSSALKHGVNGFLMPFEARGVQYADQIVAAIADPAQYAALVVSCRDRYDHSLNWDSWAIAMRAVMETVLDRKIAPPDREPEPVPLAIR